MTTTDRTPLTGAFVVLLVLVGFAGLNGDTPAGDSSAQSVVAFYSGNETREVLASILFALSAVPLLFFSASLRDRLRAALPGPSTLPTVALAGGIVAAGGFLVAAGIHFALADSAGDIDPVAAQALNTLDAGFFLPFTTGIAVLLLASSITAIRTSVLPRWMGWVGAVLFVAYFTPAGFVGFGLTGIWIVAASVLLYRREDGSDGTRTRGLRRDRPAL